MGKNGKTPGVETILRPGQILDHKYHVEKLIGLGGMLRRSGETSDPRQSRVPWIVAGVALAFSTALALWAGWTLFRR